MIRTIQILKSERGLTLLELLLAIIIISLIAGLGAQMAGSALDSWSYNKGKSELFHTGRLAMERMVTKVRNTTWVLMPLMISDPSDPGYPGSSYYPRDILAVSNTVDNDGDGLADEDPGSDITRDAISGIQGIDDNNDGLADGEDWEDDDEDGLINEDRPDGTDNDGDGRIDEDPNGAFFQSGNDDDNDGTFDEDPFDPVIYYLNGTSLMERENILTATVSDTVIAENVSEFIVLRRHVNGNTLIDIYLKMDGGENTVELSTTVMAMAMFKP